MNNVSFSSLKARAALVPLHVSKVPALMRYRTLEIGLGTGVGLDLSKYGHCNFVSARHACLYFDQYSQVRVTAPATVYKVKSFVK